MRAGELRNRITVQTGTEGSADALGETAVTWADSFTVWGAVLPQSGREFYRASQLHAEMTHLVAVRYRTGITNANRLRLGSRYLNIVAVQNVEERDVELLIVCVEAV